MFWFHFYAATQRGTLSTAWAREKAVDELKLDTLTEDGATYFLEMAHKGVYDTDNMPARWRSIFEDMEREL